MDKIIDGIGRIVAFFRKHEFDLNDPVIIPIDFYTYGEENTIQYKCKRCGKLIWSHDVNMLSLPFKLERGCAGRRCIEEWEN